MFQYQNFVFEYEPYPVGVCREFIAGDLYRQLIEQFPPTELFGDHPDRQSSKKILSELFEPDAYRAFVRRTPVYLELYRYIKSRAFIHDVLNCFERNSIQLNLFNAKITSTTLPLVVPLYHRIENALQRLRKPKSALMARFEFATLPSDGGCIRPHTDAPTKIITLVVSIVQPGEWNPAWKGGTDILRPKDVRRNYNFFNSYLDFDECETLRTIEDVPNQCIMFLKTFNSLHSVPPIQNTGGPVSRRTLTINIEAV